MNPNPVLRLADGSLELEIVPLRGGGIASFTHVSPQGRTPILREPNPFSAGVLDLASFPLVPFVNRIRGGRFEFRGREVAITPNLPGDANPLHGHGWLAEWQVERSAPAEAELVFGHPAGEWPWAYEARQHFSLDPDGLSLRLACRNLSDAPMPCGLGQHPYFPCTPETLIETQVEGAWTIDADVLPVERVPASGRFDLNRRAICAQDLDHGFKGWSGSATISTPGAPFQVELSSQQARYLHLYSPAECSFFAAEPVTHANAAINEPEGSWDQLGLRVLEPGEELALDIRIAVVPRATML